MGFLSGQFKHHEDLPEGYLRHLDRFQPATFDENLKLVKAVEEVARREGITVGQVAIAWVRSQGAIPIPGATKVDRVIENCKNVSLSEEDVLATQKILDTIPIQGDRYGGQFKDLLSG